MKNHFPPMLKHTFFLGPRLVSTTSPTSTPGILPARLCLALAGRDLRLDFLVFFVTIRRQFHPACRICGAGRCSEKIQGKDTLLMAGKSKKGNNCGMVWQKKRSKNGMIFKIEEIYPAWKFPFKTPFH